jgi:hypothetical protein
MLYGEKAKRYTIANSNDTNTVSPGLQYDTKYSGVVKK